MGEHASQVYARNLMTEREGYPVWHPTPGDHLPEDYKAHGIFIGDVGLIKENGTLDVLFNIFHPLSHPINSVVPQGFQSLDPSTYSSRDFESYPTAYSAPTLKYSKKIRAFQVGITGEASPPVAPVEPGGGFKFMSSFVEGAVLMLPQGACRSNFTNEPLLEQFIEQHGQQWIKFVKSRRRLRDHSIYLVTGHDKAQSWGVASFAGNSGRREISLRFAIGGVAGAGFSLSYQWENQISGSAQTGPPPSHSTSSMPHNQCVFVRGYKIRIRGEVLLKRQTMLVSTIENPAKIISKKSVPRAASKTADAQSRRPEDDTNYDSVAESFIETEQIPEPVELYHPSNVIAKYLLEIEPSHNMVVVHDDVWCALIDEVDEIMPSDEELIRRFQRSFSWKVMQGTIIPVKVAEFEEALNIPTGVEKLEDLFYQTGRLSLSTDEDHKKRFQGPRRMRPPVPQSSLIALHNYRRSSKNKSGIFAGASAKSRRGYDRQRITQGLSAAQHLYRGCSITQVQALSMVANELVAHRRFVKSISTNYPALAKDPLVSQKLEDALERIVTIVPQVETEDISPDDYLGSDDESTIFDGEFAEEPWTGKEESQGIMHSAGNLGSKSVYDQARQQAIKDGLTQIRMLYNSKYTQAEGLEKVVDEVLALRRFIQTALQSDPELAQDPWLSRFISEC
ncbi:hypothetical protein HGRIS_014617 [Hohenbuehelia grisea]|uniref:Uncharacterized protein n=1 Tax=Hohenbuehelia grisea TaxID=104357 RepID=A0ABR3JVT0_9AGAR